VDKELLDFLVAVRNELDQLIRKFTPKTLDQLKELIPKELTDTLTFEEKDEYFIIRPKGYLGSEVFAKVLDVVRTNAGEYISQGKNSHFRILKGG
jgi:hypothetical protein